MLFVFILLVAAGIILLVSDPKRETTRWLSALSFSGAAGGLATVTFEMVMPYAADRYTSAQLDTLLEYAAQALSLICYFGVPYFFVMFAVVYNPGFIAYAHKKTLAVLLLLPVPWMLLLTPVYPPHYKTMIIWVIPYIAAGSFLLLYRKEADRALRRTHFWTALAVLPAMLYVLMMSYILPLFDLEGMWRYNVWIVAFAFAVFALALFKYGFLGVQFLIQRRQLDMTLRAITSGTAILNHSIKNDVGKMKLFCEKILDHAIDTGQHELAADIRVVMSSSGHIQEMIHRVHDRTQELALRLGRNSLGALVDRTLEELGPRLAGVSVGKAYDADPEIWCDPEQVAEVLHNIILNAVEAMPGGGSLDIRLKGTKKMWVLEIRDSGKGIAKDELRKVLEPFYTTKSKGAGNFGLGLAYCYNVLKRHGGHLELSSRTGQGTTVLMAFPKKAGNDEPKGVKAHGGSHPDIAG